jgi:hypothetical protein
MVSPVDRQQSILQSNITERVQQTQQQHPDMQQRYFEIQLGQERKKMLHKVKDSEEADRIQLRQDESRKQQQDNQKNDEDQPRDMSGILSDDPDQGSHIDIQA